MAFIEEKLTATVPFRALCFRTGRGENKEVPNSWLTPQTLSGSLSYTWCSFLNLGVAWEPHRSPGLSTIIYSRAASVLPSGHWVSATIPFTPLPIRASPPGCSCPTQHKTQIPRSYGILWKEAGR